MPWPGRRIVIPVLVVLLLAGGTADLLATASPPPEGRSEWVVLDSGRSYLLRVPPLLRQRPALAEGRPAMIVLHPVRNGPENIAESTGFDRLADRDGVLVAYPRGVKRSFNAGACCDAAAALGVADVAFLVETVADLRKRGASRISVVGFSNGGMMAYRFACERPDLVDTVGAMSATLEIPFCRGPIRALHLHGLNDTTVPFTGGGYSERLKSFLRDVRTIPAAAPGSSIEIRGIPGFGHRWTEPGDPVDATELFWRFARMRDIPGGGA